MKNVKTIGPWTITLDEEKAVITLANESGDSVEAHYMHGENALADFEMLDTRDDIGLLLSRMA